MNSEQHALGQVLWVSKEMYTALSQNEIKNAPALLDCLSAALSHLNDEKQPLSRVMGALKRGLRSKDREFYKRVKLYFAKAYPILDYDFAKAGRHIPAIIFANDKICVQFVSGERSKAAAMCDAMKSYPGFCSASLTPCLTASFMTLYSATIRSCTIKKTLWKR